MSLDPLKLGLFVLLFLPGFIFVETCEHHLLRERKPQFEKTFEILLWSAFIWLIAFAVPVWWPSTSRTIAIDAIRQAALGSENEFTSRWIRGITSQTAWFFLSVCFWSFVAANLWGVVRKGFYVDLVVRWVTGRDWYPSVAFRFFRVNMNKAVVVRLDGRRYLGILYSAPDRKEDNYIILTEVSLVPEADAKSRHIEPLPLVQHLLLRVDEIREMQALKETILRKVDKARLK